MNTTGIDTSLIPTAAISLRSTIHFMIHMAVAGTGPSATLTIQVGSHSLSELAIHTTMDLDTDSTVPGAITTIMDMVALATIPTTTTTTTVGIPGITQHHRITVELEAFRSLEVTTDHVDLHYPEALLPVVLGELTVVDEQA